LFCVRGIVRNAELLQTLTYKKTATQS
jgi:hypothetical protein